MEGKKKNPDRMNTIGIVTVGLTGAALVYLSIIGIEAWYLNETSAVDQVAKFGKQDDVRKRVKGEQLGAITEPRLNLGKTGKDNVQLYTIGVDAAKDLIVRDAKLDPANLIPAVARSEKPTIEPAFGRPTPLRAPVAPVDPTAPPTGAPAGTPGTVPGGAGAAPGSPAGAPAVAPADATGDPVQTPAGGAPMPTGGATTPTGATGTPAAGSPPAAPATPPPTAPAAGGH